MIGARVALRSGPSVCVEVLCAKVTGRDHVRIFSKRLSQPGSCICNRRRSMPAVKNASDGRPMRQNLSYRISIIHSLLGQRTTGIYASRRLTSHQWKVLSVLYTWPPMHAARIVDLVTLDKASISRAIKGLIKRGLATRKSQLEGGMISVVLTPAGTKMYRAMEHELDEIQREVLKTLKVRQQATFFDIFDEIEAALRSARKALRHP
jgi:DNA-binding MarR family transcriptional regulator